MTNFISLSCPSCGSRLQITNQTEQFLCASCGNEYLVNRKGGIVSIEPVVEGLKEVKVGVDKTASELAIKRLKQEITGLEKDLRNARGANIDEVKTGFGMGFFGVFITVFGLWVSDGDAPIICIGIFVLGAIMGFVMGFQALMNGNQSAIDSIKSRLSQKRKELRHHQNIVNKI